jgi:hypothetical protein
MIAVLPLLLVLALPAVAAEECPLTGYWAGTAWSINVVEGELDVGKSVHGCMVYPDCSYGCDAWGADRERGDCVRKGLPYYGRLVPFGPLWRTAPTRGEDGGLNVVVVEGDMAIINHIVAPGIDTGQFLERTTLIRVGDQPPENLIDAQQRLWFLECES